MSISIFIYKMMETTLVKVRDFMGTHHLGGSQGSSSIFLLVKSDAIVSFLDSFSLQIKKGNNKDCDSIIE